MPDDDMTLSQVHSDLVARLEHDKRLRSVEQDVAVLKALPEQIKEMRTDLTGDIKAVHEELRGMHADIQNRRSNLPQWVSAAVAILAVVLVVAQALYS